MFERYIKIAASKAATDEELVALHPIIVIAGSRLAGMVDDWPIEPAN